MEKVTVEKKIHGRRAQRPGIMYSLLGAVWRTFVFGKYRVSYEFRYDIKRESGPYILISNHASRLDYIFTGVPMLPVRMNYVAGYNEFHRSHLKGVFGLLKVIPKKNFVPDLHTIRSVDRIIKAGGRVCIFPEGMSSISGANQPVAVGTGHFLKRYRIPIFYAIIKGGYLTSPKYNLKDRRGRVEVTFDRLFTPEELDAMTAEEVEARVNEALYHDDYAWNLTAGNHYDIGDEGAKRLEDLLFICPRCHREHTMLGEGNSIRCIACGNGATITDTYQLVPFDKECVIPRTQTEWFRWQRERVASEVAAEDFSLSEEVSLGMLPKYRFLKKGATSEIVGQGTLTLDRTGLSYRGTRDGAPFTFFIPSASLPTYGMCTDVSRFYTFYQGEFVEFYPKARTVEKFFLATEELHRQNGGRWQDFAFKIPTWEEE
ncbi:MAG: 1-acyl-sn-glycerol-3-phosphate acyltransferase [Clostridia bacterium]|nr:1-acyl-sn-glycerol-3-phosphate acyltransferase [Clostridia bacterium]